MSGRTGTLYVVATPIGNLEDITLRALRVLGEVPVLAAEDTRAAGVLLTRHGLWPRPGLRLLSFFAGNEAERTEELLGCLLEGQDVALISEAGTPGISDPGQRLVAAAAGRGVPVDPLPGASAPLCALVGSGLPCTRFLFLGFPPRDEGPRQELFAGLSADPATLVLLESPERAARTLADLALSLGEDRPACVARELTKRYQEFVRGGLGELARRYAESPPRGEITLVVAGADPHAARPATDLPTIEAEIDRRAAAGQGTREIAAALSLQTGLPRQRLYQLALARRRPAP